MRDVEDCYAKLCCAVIVQAARDYQSAKVLSKVSEVWAERLRELEKFFAGGGTWHLWAGNIDGQYILDRIKDIRKGREL